jgi:hypothetical protein
VDVGNDVRSGGILVVDPSKSGALRFAHKSFMEFLIAGVYANKLLERNRESNSALLITSRLGAEHLTQESLKFLSELLVSGIREDEDEKGSHASMSRRLFDVLVVRRFGGGLRGRLFASVALAESRYVAVIYRKSTESRKMRLWLYWFYPSNLIMSVSMLAMVTSTLLERLVHPRLLSTVWVLVLALAVFSASSMMMRTLMRSVVLSKKNTRDARPMLSYGLGEFAIRLWFNCCILANLSREDVADVVGTNSVVPLTEYFRSRLGIE